MDIKTIIEATADYIDRLPEGANMTTAMAVSAVFPDEVDRRCNFINRPNIDMWDVHNGILAALEKRGHVALDYSEHEGKIEGLPYNLDFYVRRERTDEM